ncbi:unnamed protein product [Pseudo-nitzschia multistriata]|uniref:Uncharacterized protein n=1 Tax=Pseudo-nitzschia multistriata TaxID=183589 RepID=A0A448Z3B0_9STRA|nr:unnamed protein product [Pseudo-nitzschia multistriata]
MRTESDSPPHRHYKWLVVGGGIHGVSIASRLIGEGIIDGNTNGNNSLLIVDEQQELLYSWKERTRATGMTFLRSAVGFHLDIPAEGLRAFASGYGHNGNKQKQKQKPLSKKAKRQSKNNQHRSKHGLGTSNGYPNAENPDTTTVGRDYQRPSLKMFNDHCDNVIDKYKLMDFHFRGRVESIDVCDEDGGNKPMPLRVVVRNSSGVDADANASGGVRESPPPGTTIVSADNIVLAVGNDDPAVPEWVTHLTSENNGYNYDKSIYHLLQLPNGDPPDAKTNPLYKANTDPNWDDFDRHEPRHVAIIGGGISAVHKALQIASKNSRDEKKALVHIVSRHRVREQQFDTHQDWMMTQQLAQLSLDHGGKGLTKRQRKFGMVESPAERRRIIAGERIPGTVPSYMTRAGTNSLEKAMGEGSISWYVASVARASRNNEATGGAQTASGSTYTLELTNGETVGPLDEIILATGLGKKVPGNRILSPLAASASLPLGPCGYPLVDESLLWKPRMGSTTTSTNIFVAGGLAELELGPSARNIAGARMGAERIARAARRRTASR